MKTIMFADKKTRLVKSKFFNLFWIENSQGKRISSMFRLLAEETVGPFVKVTTQTKTIIFNKNSDNITFISKSVKNVCLEKLTEDVYEIRVLSCWKERNTWKKELLYDRCGNLISDKYSDVTKPHYGMIGVELDGQWGFIDEKGTCVITPAWKHSSLFNEYGYSVVTFKGENKIAVIDKKGIYVLGPMPYSSARFIGENLLQVVSGGRKGIIDLKGQVVIPTEYDYIEKKDNHFIVKRGAKYGLFGVNGECIFECIYPEIIETPDKFVVQDFAKLETPKFVEVSK